MLETKKVKEDRNSVSQRQIVLKCENHRGKGESSGSV